MSNGGKIFPRNLTANADYMVPGNPVTSRPEGGVDNTHPGLEFDMRNIDRGFFPGLRFDFQYKLGARVAEVRAHELEAATAQGSVDPHRDALFLWYVFGTFGADPSRPAIVDLFPMDGYDVLRRIHDLEPGIVAVVIGGAAPAPKAAALARLQQLLTATPAAAAAHVELGAQGKVAWAVLVGHRARYLDNDGVIDPDAMEPGELTQSLCSPWQWDFADCGCYYWAASRPDIVMGAGGGDQNLNFQRQNRTGPGKTPEQMREWAKWMDDVDTISQPQMITRWESLPTVVGERELRDGTAPLWAPPGSTPPPVHSREQIVTELTYLATVEHALCVQYLYAHYSLRIPDATSYSDAECRTLRRAAELMFSLARDEMQHLRWVNAALARLGAAPSVGRATVFRSPKGKPVELNPLTDAMLAHFIQIEQSVPDTTGAPTGLYVALLESVDRHLQRAGSEPERIQWQRVKEVVSLLVDEGVDHYRQLNVLAPDLTTIALDSRLRVSAPAERVRIPPGASPNDPAFTIRELQEEGDEMYRQIVRELRDGYRSEGATRSGDLQTGVAYMQALDHAGQRLAEHGAGLLFTMQSLD